MQSLSRLAILVGRHNLTWHTSPLFLNSSGENMCVRNRAPYHFVCYFCFVQITGAFIPASLAKSFLHNMLTALASSRHEVELREALQQVPSDREVIEVTKSDKTFFWFYCDSHLCYKTILSFDNTSFPILQFVVDYKPVPSTKTAWTSRGTNRSTWMVPQLYHHLFLLLSRLQTSLQFSHI